MAGKSVNTVNKSTGEVSEVPIPPAVLELRQQLTAAAESPEFGSNAQAIILGIQNAIAQATTAEEVFDILTQGTEGVPDWADKPILMHSVRVMESGPQFRTEGSLNKYMLVGFSDPSGVEHVITTGGETLVAALWKLRLFLPLHAVFTVHRTSANYDTFKLRPANSAEKALFLKPAF